MLTVLGSAVLLVTWFTRRKQREEEQEEATEREQRKEVKRHGLVRLFSLIPALGAVIAFVLTENMKNPMAFTDKWTLLMVVIFVIQLVVMLLARKSDENRGQRPGQGTCRSKRIIPHQIPAPGFLPGRVFLALHNLQHVNFTGPGPHLARGTQTC